MRKIIVGGIGNLDANQTVVGIYLDLTKAFDTVNHDFLLYKLQNYGIAYQWFKSYLCNRQQYTVVNYTSSNLTNVLCGVLQCPPVLGPLLFLLYIRGRLKVAISVSAET